MNGEREPKPTPDRQPAEPDPREPVIEGDPPDPKTTAPDPGEEEDYEEEE